MQKRMIGIYLDGNERAALLNLAERERRDMRDQAALIIRQELIERGLLPADAPTTTAQAAQAAGVTHGNA